FSATPSFTIDNTTAPYEQFTSQHPFDLDQKLIVFNPVNAPPNNSNGFNIQVEPLNQNLDLSSPVVTSITPANGTSNVSVGVSIVATFNKSLYPTQDFSNVITVVPNVTGSQPVAGTTTIDSTGTILTFTPTAPLADSTSFTATAANARDTFGDLQLV